MHHHRRGAANAPIYEKSVDVHHRIRRAMTWLRYHLAPPPPAPVTTLRAPVRPTPTARPVHRVPSSLDTPLNTDTSPLVRPYLTAYEAQYTERQAHRFARIRTMHGEFAV